MEEHECHLCHVLDILRKAQIYAKKSKCTFFVDKVAYLGFIVSKVCILPEVVRISRTCRIM